MLEQFGRTRYQLRLRNPGLLTTIDALDLGTAAIATGQTLVTDVQAQQDLPQEFGKLRLDCWF